MEAPVVRLSTRFCWIPSHWGLLIFILGPYENAYGVRFRTDGSCARVARRYTPTTRIAARLRCLQMDRFQNGVMPQGRAYQIENFQNPRD